VNDLSVLRLYFRHAVPLQHSTARHMTSTSARILEKMEAEFRAALGERRVDELRNTLQEMAAFVTHRVKDGTFDGRRT